MRFRDYVNWKALIVANVAFVPVDFLFLHPGDLKWAVIGLVVYNFGWLAGSYVRMALDRVKTDQ